MAKKSSPHNTALSSLKVFKNIKELLNTAKEDRNLALEVFHTAKRDLENAIEPEDRDSLRKLMVESLKLAQSSKASTLKVIEMYVKHQDASLNGAAEEARKETESFMGD